MEINVEEIQRLVHHGQPSSDRHKFALPTIEGDPKRGVVHRCLVIGCEPYLIGCPVFLQLQEIGRDGLTTTKEIRLGLDWLFTIVPWALKKLEAETRGEAAPAVPDSH